MSTHTGMLMIDSSDHQAGRALRLSALASLGLFFFPLSNLLTSHSSLAALAETLCALAVFISLYVWLLFQIIPLRVGQTLPLTTGALAALTLLAMAVNLAFPDDLRWALLFLYVVVIAGFAFPLKVGLAAVGSATALAAATAFALRSTFSPEIQQQVLRVVGNGILELLFLGGGAVAVRRLLETTQALRIAREKIAQLAVEEERQRFARDLHDLLGHSLSLIVLKSEVTRRFLPDQPHLATSEVREIEQVARTVLQEVREVVRGYRQPTLATELAGACIALDAANITAHVEQALGPLAAGIEAVLAWTVREGVTNVLRHSQAQHCRIRLLQTKEEVRAEIIDDGTGGASWRPGSGLSGLGERVATISGQLEADTLPQGGFCLRVTLPLSSSPPFLDDH
jgi:two-component system sensor histidine kinase DesK